MKLSKRLSIECKSLLLINSDLKINILKRKLFAENRSLVNKHLSEFYSNRNKNDSIKPLNYKKIPNATDDDSTTHNVDINNKTQSYPVKVMPNMDPIPSMYAWIPLQKNLMVISYSIYLDELKVIL